MLRPFAVILVGLAIALPTRASGHPMGGVTVPSSGARPVGGVTAGQHLHVIPGRPVTRLFALTPGVLTAGAHPRVVVRVAESNAKTVRVRVSFVPLSGTGHALSVDAGRVKVGTQVQIAWPSSAALAAGHYRVVLHAVGPGGRTLVRRAHASGRTTLTVRPAPKPKAKPAPPSAPTTSSAGTFPVQGPHTYGDGFGAPRQGYTHQGQDVLAALGTPVVAPLAGTIDTTGYQASAAGYYVVENADDGDAFFFAHCAHASTVVTPGESVAEGQPLCHVGQTGDATGPHLHFELWIGGWRVDSASHPVDPLAQLKAWDH